MLQRQEAKLMALNLDDIVEEIIQIKEFQREENKNFDSPSILRDFDPEKVSYFNIKSLKVKWENNQISFMHVLVNTTEIKKLEEVKANTRCQQLMFTSVSHEFRTPINAFSNSLQIIDLSLKDLKSKLIEYPWVRNNFDPIYQRFDKFVKIGEASWMLLVNLVDDILDMAKFSSNNFKVFLGSFKLSDIIKDIKYIFEFQFNDKNLYFEINYSQGLENEVLCSDAMRIKQVLINLLSNSLKFTERGGLSITITEYKQNFERFISFYVKDTGIGISQNDIWKLFKMFGMISKHRQQLNRSGSGIGLSISRKIVESLGGHIKVYSEEGKWTAFEFNIKDMNYKPEIIDRIEEVKVCIYHQLYLSLFASKNQNYNNINHF